MKAINALNHLSTTYRSLQHRNYRLFFGGQSISVIGTWMQQITVNWLTYRLTHSSFLLGVVGFSGRITTFFLAPFMGVFIDRWNRHRILVITQILSMIQALLLALLVLTDKIAVWYIVSLSLVLGCINSLDQPSRQSFIIDMVENKEDLANAIALNSSIGTSARFLGPSIAGILIAAVGEGVCFLLDGLSFIAVIMSLLGMKIKAKKTDKKNAPVWKGIKAGFAYVTGFLPIRAILLLIALISLMAMPYTLLMPVIVKTILHGDARTYGFLVASAGCGALAAAVFLASRKSVPGLERIISINTYLFAIGLIIFSLSNVLWLAIPSLFMAGFGTMASITSCNTVLQTIVEDDKRGRVMSFFSMAFFGMIPFGSLIACSLAEKIGTQSTIMCCGIICIIGAATFSVKLPFISRMLRPIYIKKAF